MKIETLTRSNLHLINTIDSTFTVDSKLKIKLSNNKFSYEIESVSSYRKTYEYEHPDYSDFINSDSRTVFFAFEKEILEAQITIIKHWNGYAYINDFTVKEEYRGKGIGKALMEKAIDWARKYNCIGVEAETQDVNVKACLFYEKQGFTLGAFDMYRYKSSEKEKDEIAINWYLLF